MNTVTTIFLSTFTTLLAIVNPLAVLPVFLKLLEGQDKSVHRRVAWKACSYATLLLFFFLIFGTLLLKIFEVPLSMVRIVGGIHAPRRLFRCCHRRGIDLPWRHGGDPDLFACEGAITRKADQ